MRERERERQRDINIKKDQNQKLRPVTSGDDQVFNNKKKNNLLETFQPNLFL